MSVSYSLIPEGGDSLRDFLITKGYALVTESENQFIFALPPKEEEEDLEGENDEKKDKEDEVREESIEINIDEEDNYEDKEEDGDDEEDKINN